MAHDGSALQPKSQAYSLRLRLAVVLTLASLPGVVLGAMQAHRAFANNAQSEQLALTRSATQVAARLDDVVAGATILAESLSQSPSVRSPDGECNRALIAAAEQSDRFGGVARLDAEGRVVCSSTPAARGITVGDMSWFQSAIVQNGPTLSPARIARVGGYQILSVAAPVRQGARTVGLTVISLRGQWIIDRAASSSDDASIVLFDSAGVPFASVRRPNAPKDVISTARRALAGETTGLGDIHTATASTTGQGIRIVAIAPAQSLIAAWRALLIAAAPLLAVLAALTAVWFALDRWVLRWIDRLVVHAESRGGAAQARADLPGAPPELQLLGAAFDAAIAEARARASDLSGALDKNLALNRELHHRVKNSLQVFASGLARQLRRTSSGDARDALLEARLRLLPFSLTIQYSPAREDLIQIDTAGYLPELTRQITSVLAALSPDVALTVEADHQMVRNEIATAMGMIVADTLTAAYLSGGGVVGRPLVVRFTVGADGTSVLACGVETTAQDQTQHAVDAPLVTQLARQVYGEAKIAPGPFVTIARAARPHEEA